MKNYLEENLTQEEINYIKSIIKKSANTYLKKYYKISQNESLCLDDETFDEEFIDTRNYNEDNFINKILDTKILRDISALKPYSQYEQEKIVDLMDNYACESGIEHLIMPLTFNEKLVVFLLYVENYQVNEVAILLGISRIAVWKRDKSIKLKIKKIKEELENGKK